MTCELAAAFTPRDADAALRRAVKARIKPLVWVQSKMTSWNDDWHTVPTAYTVRCADENGWKWTGVHGVFGYTDFPNQAKAAAQADYNRRILAALGWEDGE